MTAGVAVGSAGGGHVAGVDAHCPLACPVCAAYQRGVDDARAGVDDKSNAAARLLLLALLVFVAWVWLGAGKHAATEAAKR